MTDNILRIDPELHFPIGELFEVPDQFNGHQRGTNYYRSPFTGELKGPFKNAWEASFLLSQEEDGA